MLTTIFTSLLVSVLLVAGAWTFNFRWLHVVEIRLEQRMIIFLLAALVQSLPAHARGTITTADVSTCNEATGQIRISACVKIAEETNDLNTIHTVIHIYISGKGIPKDTATAAKWIEKAANLGDVVNMTAIGRMYQHGVHVEKNEAKAEYWFRRGAEKGSKESQGYLGRLLLDRSKGKSNTAEAFALLIKASEQGDLPGQASLLLWLQSLPTPENRSLLTSWISRLSSSSDSDVLFQIGNAFSLGRGVDRDQQKASVFYLRSLDAAVAEGDKEAEAGAIHNLSILNLETPVDRRDLSKVRKYVEKLWTAESSYTAIAGLTLLNLDLYEGRWKQDPTTVRNHAEKLWLRIQDEWKKDDSKYFDSVKLIAIMREAGVGGAVDIAGARDIYDKMKKHGVQGTESKLSEDDSWSPRSSLRFWQKSLLADTTGPFTQEQQRDLGLSMVRDIVPNVSIKNAARPVLEFDMNVVVEKSVSASDAQITEHVEMAAEILKTCDVRLRKARLWKGISASSLENLKNNPQPLVNVYFGPPTEKPTRGYATANKKTVVLYWPESGFPIRADRTGGAIDLLAHELGHVLDVPHPNNLDASVMQYGVLGYLARTFTPEQCEIMRKNELLTPASSPSAVQHAGAEKAPSIKPVADKTANGKVTPQQAALNARFDSTFAELRQILSQSNSLPFSRFTLHALALKYDVPWSDVVNLLSVAMNWRPENQFSAGRDFKSGLPAATDGLDKVFYRKENIKELVERDLGAMRKQVMSSEKLKFASLVDGGYINLSIGQTIPSTVAAELSTIAEDEDYNLYVVGGALLIVDPRTKIIVHVQPQIINIVKGTKNIPEIWVSRGSALNESRIRAMSSHQYSEPPIATLGNQGGMTPASIIGGKVISPEEVLKLYQAAADGTGPKFLVFSGLNSPLRLPNAANFSQLAVTGDFNDQTQKNLAQFMSQKNYAKDQLIVTYCHHNSCWLSYNLAIRLINLGYTNVNWMREGQDGWIARDYPMVLLK